MAAADVNGDGAPDLLFANQTGSASFIYLNRNGRFDRQNRWELETHRAMDCLAADFNRDGFLDVFFSNHARGQRSHHRFLIFIAGAAEGFSKERRKGLRTLGAWGAAAADLNEDGWTDLVVANYKENDVLEIPSFVYWNSAQGFEVSRRTPLITRGAQGVSVADFDGDHHLDVLFVNTKNLFENTYHPNYLYWGRADGRFSVENRLELWGFMSQWSGMVDLDDDGDVDLIFSNYNEGYLPGDTEKWGYQDLYIYWNENNRFDFHRRTMLPIYMVHGGLLIADIDRDGYLDILAGQEHVPAHAKEQGIPEGSLIYWGSADGWVVSERSVVPAAGTRMPALADLNKDGHLDLIFGHNAAGGEASIFFTDGTRNVKAWRRQFLQGSERTGQLQVADLNRDGWLDIVCTHGKQTDDVFHIYYGDPESRYDIRNRVEIRGAWAKTMNVADVNGDGWLDLLCSNYWHPSRPFGRNGLSHVLLGGPDGYRFDRKISFPTRGGDGTVVSDFNFDGYVDIFWANHREDGDYNQIGRSNNHMTDSYVFFGTAQGFRQEPDLRLPGRGVHFRKTTDELGHVYDRGFQFDYLSSPYEMGDRKPLWIDWEAQTPHRTSVKFQVRVADTRQALAKAPWLGPQGKGSFFNQKKSSLKHLPAGRWLQYRAVLDTFNGVHSPILEAVEIGFE
ncbi:MAG: VCBS repeat-containing protein [candidate division KSB1 bacterium]|nr:VCBS repeat-containing protein [candidate division KSB1 bacterium]